MNKSDLVNRLHESHPDLPKARIEEIVDIVFEAITDALAKGDRVELRDFGAFSVRQRQARIARNPRNGATFPVPAKVFPHFIPGKALRQKIRESG